jgi:hypothetical protein
MFGWADVTFFRGFYVALEGDFEPTREGPVKEDKTRLPPRPTLREIAYHCSYFPTSIGAMSAFLQFLTKCPYSWQILHLKGSCS